MCHYKQSNSNGERRANIMISFTIENKTVNVFQSTNADMPVIYLNTFANEGKQIFQYLQNFKCPDFTLIEISNLKWNSDMVPWNAPSVFESSGPLSGGADEYIKVLIEKIVPKAEKIIKGIPLWNGLAGYSLAGLFAVYAVYKTDMFSRTASVSGSLWFPGIKEYIFSNDMKIKPKSMYFSIGDKECRTRNRFLKCVQQNTEDIEQFYKDKGIDTVFQLNPGSHYKNAVERSAAGIMWLLSR